jgi:hypothetical protein
MKTSCRIIGIDPSGESCGMVVLDDGYIIKALNVTNSQFYVKVTNYLLHQNCFVVIEDIAPYSLRLMQQVIDTCKFIGELVYRLRIEAGANVVLIQRSYVKKWVFDTFPDVCLPLIDKKIESKMYDACSIETRELIRVDGNGRGKRKGSYVYVDDKIVTESMKYLYKIPLPKAGKGYNYGLQTHSWQALAVACSYLHTNHFKP